MLLVNKDDRDGFGCMPRLFPVNSPPDNCGGAWGYAELRQILADPSAEQHQGMLDGWARRVSHRCQRASHAGQAR
jgi:hypothetical protein